MGGPMEYGRFVHRNHLEGDYESTYPEQDAAAHLRSMFAGDLRRLERDTMDETMAPIYAGHAGVTVQVWRQVMASFFKEGCFVVDCQVPAHGEWKPAGWSRRNPEEGE